MGSSSSSLSELPTNQYLLRLCSSEVISANDPFWNQLLSYTFQVPRNSSDHRLLEESTANLCKNFIINNCTTGNFGSLVHVFLLRAAELKASTQCEDNIFTWQTYNAMFIIRNLCKSFVENLSEEVIVQQFEAKSPADESAPDWPLIDELLCVLIEIFTDVPVKSYTFAIHLECLNMLLILLSVQIFQVQQGPSKIYQAFMQGKCSMHASVLMKVLLQTYIKQEKCPAEFVNHQGNSRLYGITAAVASGVWNVLTLGMGNRTNASDDEISTTILAEQSLLVILVLANHCTSESGLPNPYRDALFTFTNAQEHYSVTIDMSDSDDSAPPSEVDTGFKADMTALFNTLSETLKDDQTTLLLYLMLHRNHNMKAFILSRTNIDQLVMPLLKILYNAQEKNSHHIYMVLIVLLILSEDDCFNKAVHEINLKNVGWFKERQISEVTLGGLIILVVIRTMQYNMTRMRDKYLHTNCLAALANMSSQFQGLHPYVTQRIVSLFSLLQKKHSRLVEQIRLSALDGGRTAAENTDAEIEPGVDFVQDLSVVEEVIRMLLEIINSCLSHSLHHNPNLIYTLLYQKEIFSHFRTHPTFQDIIQNIDTVLSYFTAKVEKLDKNVSVQEVVEVIKQGAVQFRRDRLKKFPELKFKYVEEDEPEEFFVPYIWSLVYHSSQLYFNSTRIQLFSLQS